MKRRITTVILTIAVLMTFTLPSVFAVGSGSSEGDTPTIGVLEYHIREGNTAWVTCYYAANSPTSIDIPSTVTYKGITYTITGIYKGALVNLRDCKSVNVPASITSIGQMALGYYDLIYDEEEDEIIGGKKVSGFTIIGKTGSEAEKYAKANGFIFRDPDAEKEWNGTRSSKVPAVKSAKFKGAKKKVTVSWKKATKKNLKKFDKVEVQVCKDKKFQMSNTKRVLVKKSKKSTTIKKLKKGTYYVRVRNVKGSGPSKLVSKWSKVKKVKVK